jgi:hypothetical protein
MIGMTISGISFANPVFIYAIPVILAAFLILNKSVLNKKNSMLALLRCAALASLLLVLAMPYTVKERTITQESASIMVVDDQSDSMGLFQSSLDDKTAEAIMERTQGMSKVESVKTSGRNHTAIGETIYQGILGSSLKSNIVILSSDGNNNRGIDPLDVAGFAAESNTKIFSILPQRESSEVYLEGIYGPEKVPANSEYSASVRIDSVGVQSSYALKVLIDGKSVFETDVVQNEGSKEFPVTYTFNEKGPHHITAEIFPESEDQFSKNNKFNKVVNVIARPRLLLLTENNSSPLRTILEDLYDVQVESTMPANLEGYSAVIINDMGVQRISDSGVVRGFLNDGGGLLVVGGNSSYGMGGYYESSFENFLPVKSKESDEERGDQINVVLLLDISGSTGFDMAGQTKIDVEKAIAVNMIRDLGKNARIGVAVFNSDSYLVQPVRELADTSAIEERISRLQFGGGTYVVVGLIRARDMLNLVQGSKYIVLISDGVTNYPVKAFEEASEMSLDDIVLHTVGVGFDTDESFMQGLARRGNGVYFSPSETERVKVIIGALDEDDAEEKEKFSMIVTDYHHFITEGLESLNVSLADFNDVSAKSSAQILAATPTMKPLLTVWRFGLGRVASLTVDDGNEWANKLYSKGNSRVVSSTINWIVGDPERHKDLRIDCMDTRVGEETSIVVKSESDYPQVNVEGKTKELSRIDDESYYFDYYPESTGFASVGSGSYSCDMAINYPEEYADFQMDTELLTAMAQISGGEVYQPGEIQKLLGDVSEYTVDESTGIVTERNNMQIWFTLMALLLFFSDVAVRRLNDIRKGRK